MSNKSRNFYSDRTFPNQFCFSIEEEKV